jgi:hypothetical protein
VQRFPIVVPIAVVACLTLDLAAYKTTIGGQLSLAGYPLQTAQADLTLSPSARQLTGAELRERMSNKTFRGEYLLSSNYRTEGVSWTEYYAPNGRLVYRERGQYLHGRWSIEGDEVCFVYDPPADGVRHCARTYDDGGILKDVASSGKDAGKVIGHVTSIEDGNPASLPLE